ncbi:hypothetical protein [uncultured Jannaschia sp.]|uniref:hypothetical protein n=1 Tax=uncultured Jannaschia sp. TaxID=293347 RepID=UPI002602066E|nr:hypothetical protein [uncultured Jannaschia sp.]
MRRWHFYVMGWIALIYGLLAAAEYVLVSYELKIAWLHLYPQVQIVWLETLPNWVHGVWAGHSLLALVGALCLLARVRAAVWMLAFAFLTLLVLAIWALFFAEPTMVALTGGGVLVWVTTGLVLLLSFLLYLYVRQEKVAGEVF